MQLRIHTALPRDHDFMKANPDKFQAICTGKKSHDTIEQFQIGSTLIKCKDNVTLLGVNIDFNLNFNDHVSEIGRKASKQLTILQRLGRFLTKQGKLTIHNSFIMSNCSYCPVAWHFCSMASTRKMEKIQERALRFINDDFDLYLRDLLVSNNTDLLHIGGMKLMAGEVFRLLHLNIIKI